MRSPFWFLTSANIKPVISWGFQSSIHLDMGCGSNARNPFNAKKLIGGDILPHSKIGELLDFEYIKLDLSGDIPLANDSIESISGFDFLEHLPRGSLIETNLFIKFMNEASRILRRGGILLLVTPAYPSPAAFQDPTHVNFISEQTVHYFVGNNPGATNLGYGFTGRFELISQEWVGPFSKVWIPRPSEGIKQSSDFLSILKQLNWIRKKLGRIRSLISSLRKPTHLLWVLRKI
jgi:SAM-dependent methyltransferase